MIYRESILLYNGYKFNIKWYGACGNSSCILYNLYVAASVTTQGRSCISAAGLLFEMFLANNVKFGSLNEVITFIDNVIHKEERKYNDNIILDENITVSECFYKLMSTCGFHYIPSHSDLLIVWEILCKLKQEDLNRLFYKNNLYSFMDNTSMSKAIIYLLQSLQGPFLNPNKAPKEIQVELDEFCDILMEYVYYPHQIIDRMDHYRTMDRSVSIVTDTDSLKIRNIL